MAKITINLRKPIFELSDAPDAKDGIKPTEIDLGRSLGNMLKASQTGDPLKYLCWAMDLFKTGVIEVDAADYEELTRFIKSAPAWALIRGQLLQEFQAAKEAAKQT